jgi:hypothetical protein
MDEQKLHDEDKNTTPASPLTEDEAIQCQIGNTIYKLTAKFDQSASEGLLDKLWRLMKQDNINYL